MPGRRRLDDPSPMLLGNSQDPSALTTQQLLRELMGLRELIEARLDGIEGRMESSDKAVELLQAFADRTPTTKDVQHEVVALREVVMEKFVGVDKQFTERDARQEQTTKDSVKAVDAAFASADKAITKTETSFTKQQDEQSKRIDAVAQVSNEKIDDLKQRITTIESRANGINQASDRSSNNFGLIIAGAGTFIIGMTAVVSVVAYIVTRAPVPAYVPLPVAPPSAVVR